MLVEIRATPFNPLEELARHQESLAALRGRYGATASFVGTMRDHNEGEPVRAMTLEHYPGMTEKHLHEIAESACGKWNLIDTLIIHRVGRIEIGDPIVLVATWSAHRKEAFEACRAMMEDLKSRAPFWKQEETEQGKRWVDKNTPG